MPSTDDEHGGVFDVSLDAPDGDRPGIGKTLRQERVRQGQSIADVCRDTRLPRWMVDGLETESLSLDDAQNKAYLRIYARELGLDAEGLLRDLGPAREPEEAAPPITPLSRPLGYGYEEKEPETNRFTPPRPGLLVGLAVSAAVGAIIGVLVWGGTPTVELTSPAPPTGQEQPATPEPEPDAAADDATVDEVEADGDETEVTPPEETRVQVLHTGDEAAAEQVATVLEDLGYGHIEMDATLSEVERTTVLYVDGWGDEAEALRSRDERFAEIGPNTDYTADVDLHVVVGPDWDDEE